MSNIMSIDFTMLIQIINFLILVYVFWKYFYKKIGKVLEQRKEIVLSEFADIENQKTELESQKLEMEKLTSESKKRATNIMIRAEKNADELKTKIMSETNTKRDRMLITADLEIEKRKQEAKKELEKEVMELASDLSGKIIKENLDSGMQDIVIDNLIDKIGV